MILNGGGGDGEGTNQALLWKHARRAALSLNPSLLLWMEENVQRCARISGFLLKCSEKCPVGAEFSRQSFRKMSCGKSPVGKFKNVIVVGNKNVSHDSQPARPSSHLSNLGGSPVKCQVSCHSFMCFRRGFKTQRGR